MGVRFPPPAPSKLTAYQLVGFFCVYFCGCFAPYTTLSAKYGILPEYLPVEFLVSVNSIDAMRSGKPH
jgi:hypothetical protein